jgi:uncharacterized membrane protein YeaQ/YmgE (transglycosylase-associated protein family)
MNVAIWVVAGALLGWAGYAYLNVNAGRGVIISITIGVLGGFFGGNVLAPMLGAITDAPNDFNGFSLFVASASAAGCLLAADLIARRFEA